MRLRLINTPERLEMLLQCDDSLQAYVLYQLCVHMHMSASNFVYYWATQPYNL